MADAKKFTFYFNKNTGSSQEKARWGPVNWLQALKQSLLDIGIAPASITSNIVSEDNGEPYFATTDCPQWVQDEGITDPFRTGYNSGVYYDSPVRGITGYVEWEVLSVKFCCLVVYYYTHTSYPIHRVTMYMRSETGADVHITMQEIMNITYTPDHNERYLSTSYVQNRFIPLTTITWYVMYGKSYFHFHTTHHGGLHFSVWEIVPVPGSIETNLYWLRLGTTQCCNQILAEAYLGGISPYLYSEEGMMVRDSYFTDNRFTQKVPMFRLWVGYSRFGLRGYLKNLFALPHNAHKTGWYDYDDNGTRYFGCNDILTIASDYDDGLILKV